MVIQLEHFLLTIPLIVILPILYSKDKYFSKLEPQGKDIILKTLQKNELKAKKTIIKRFYWVSLFYIIWLCGLVVSSWIIDIDQDIFYFNYFF